MNLEREFEPYAFCVNSGHLEADLARDDVAATATTRAPPEHRTAALSALTFHLAARRLPSLAFAKCGPSSLLTTPLAETRCRRTGLARSCSVEGERFYRPLQRTHRNGR
jgi:hypothetical protein